MSTPTKPGEARSSALVPKTRDAIVRGWTRLEDSRALVIGGLVLGGAVIWGAAQAGIVSAVIYRLFRKRRRRGDGSAMAAGGTLTDASLRWIARVAIKPASVPALVIRVAEVIAISYFAYRAIEGRRRGQGQLAPGRQSLALPQPG